MTGIFSDVTLTAPTSLCDMDSESNKCSKQSTTKAANVWCLDCDNRLLHGAREQCPGWLEMGQLSHSQSSLGQLKAAANNVICITIICNTGHPHSHGLLFQTILLEAMPLPGWLVQGDDLASTPWRTDTWMKLTQLCPEISSLRPGNDIPGN